VSSLISIVIPTYNHAHFLGRALQSVLDQTYTHWEALVIDNHSQDNTDEVVNSFSDPRIRLFKIHNHGVIAASRNLGMREASGEWIAFLDSDDYWYPGKLEILMAAAAAEDAYDVLSNDELMVDIKTGTKQLSQCGPYQKNFYKVLLIEGNRLSPSAAMVRRELLARHSLAFDESQDYATVEDYDFWLNLARCGARFKFIHEVLGEYVIHETNSSILLARHWKNCETLLHNHVFSIQRFHPSPDRLWELVFSRLQLMQVKRLVADGEFWQAFTLAMESLINSPKGTATYLFSRLKKLFKK
jgi:glycosyltransferase involved in cell wall biosynthesis